jgi:hypothetical protein
MIVFPASSDRPVEYGSRSSASVEGSGFSCYTQPDGPSPTRRTRNRVQRDHPPSSCMAPLTKEIDRDFARAQIELKMVAPLMSSTAAILPLAPDPCDVIGIECEVYDITVQFQLFQRMLHSTECLLGLEPRRIVLLRDIDRAEEGADTTLKRPGQIPVAILFASTYIATLAEVNVHSGRSRTT